ncbi:hypothetical protein [Secundilactobacillus folii]|uniref:Uncharacterized protein n=1 Tax=Secundilactobacillus folii TaxID=2678357 RepID=A0A7X2XT60_9LACO|nr:hypothetical protein [Secundilactobacillus folii]MTV81123.1 hypothetical protein [Secundilactobacillus folii]
MSEKQLTAGQQRLFRAQLVVQGSATVALIGLLIKIIGSHLTFLSMHVLIALAVIILLQWLLGSLMSAAIKRVGPVPRVKRPGMAKLAGAFELALFLVLGIFFLVQ